MARADALLGVPPKAPAAASAPVLAGPGVLSAAGGSGDAKWNTARFQLPRRGQVSACLATFGSFTFSASCRRGRNLSRLPRLHLLLLQDHDDATSHGSVLVASVLRWLQAGDIHGAAAGGAHTTMNVRRCGLVATYFPLTPH